MHCIQDNKGGKRRRVSGIEGLTAGDRVAFSWKFFEHHAVVVSVHQKEKKFNVVGLGLTVPRNILNGKTIISMKTHQFPMRYCSLYVVEYSQCLPASKVVDNAVRTIGQVVEYNPFTRNSKHHAHLMKTHANIQEGELIQRTKTPVTIIEDLEPGHQVAFERRLPYEHHGIVISVHPNEDVFNVVQVLGNLRTDEHTGKTISDIENKSHTFSEEKGTVYVVQYEPEECLPASEVICNASRLDGASVEYSLIRKNCEHYASAMKTGKGISKQIEAISKSTGTIRSVSLLLKDVLMDIP